MNKLWYVIMSQKTSAQFSVGCVIDKLVIVILYLFMCVFIYFLSKALRAIILFGSLRHFLRYDPCLELHKTVLSGMKYRNQNNQIIL